MGSTFAGLEIAKRGMFTQQSALQVTSQNVANANTPGYSRQRINFVETSPFPAPGMNRPEIPGQMGTGVEAGSVQRVRESFLDNQFRGENNKLGYWQSSSDSLKRLEEIMNEPSDTGLSNTMDQFWQSLQDLATNPTNDGARSVVAQRGTAVAETFNYLAGSLNDIKKDIENETDVTSSEVNSLTKQIAAVNKQIGEVEPHGYLPNDLYDERDRLIDQLSSLVNINVTYTAPTSANASKLALGQAEITLVDDKGMNLKNSSGVDLSPLVSDSNSNALTIDSSAQTISLNGDSVAFSEFESSGKVKALIEASSQTYSDMLKKLDDLANTFATEFNKVQNDGWSPNEIDSQPQTNGAVPFFESSDGSSISATNIKVSDAISKDPNNIATASGTNPTKGDTSNALALANVINGDVVKFQDTYQSIIGDMAVKSQQAERLSGNSGILLQSVDNRRMSVSSVSLDEEMSNMIQFQHAYSASARMITMEDEILDKIINGMGTGGR